MRDESFGVFFTQSGLSYEDAEVMLGVSQRQIRRYVAGDVTAPKLVHEKVQEQAARRAASRPPARFRFIDLFAGIGGLRLGFEAIGGHCVFTSEWDRWSNQTYRRNFPDGADRCCQSNANLSPLGADRRLVAASS